MDGTTAAIARMILMSNMRSIEQPASTKRQPIAVIPPPMEGSIGVQSRHQDHVVQAVDSRYRYLVTGKRGDAYVHMSAWSPPVPDGAGAFATGFATGFGAAAMLPHFNPNHARTPFTAELDEFTEDLCFVRPERKPEIEVRLAALGELQR